MRRLPATPAFDLGTCVHGRPGAFIYLLSLNFHPDNLALAF